MAIKLHNPKGMRVSPEYSLGVEVSPNARWLYVSGQVGFDARGRVSADFEKQALQAWKPSGAEVRRHGTEGHREDHDLRHRQPSPADVSLDARKIPGKGAVFRLDAAGCCGVALPELLIEVEVVAARA